jgi:hypothetical protein
MDLCEVKFIHQVGMLCGLKVSDEDWTFILVAAHSECLRTLTCKPKPL